MFNASYDMWTTNMANSQNVAHTAQVGFGSNEAVLYLFSPKPIPQQIFRPYQINIDTRGMEILMNDPNGIQSAINKNFRDPSISRAILPSSNGLPVDLNTINQCWTYVLMLDEQLIDRGVRTSLMGPKQRIIVTGYCSQEPILPASIGSSNLIFNEQCFLIPTYSSAVSSNKSLSARGSSQSTFVVDADFVARDVAALYNQDMYLGTPADLRSTTSRVGNELQGMYGSIALTSKPNTSSITGIVKSPANLLKNIGSAVDSAIDIVQTESSASRFGNPIFNSSLTVAPDTMDIHEEIGQAFSNNAINANHMIPSMVSIDTTLPISMRDLNYKYPNMLVQPFRIPASSPWDTIPQNTVSKKTIMSNLAANSLLGIVPACGLSMVMFTYESYAKQTPHEIDCGNGGYWHVDNASTIVPSSQNEIIAAVNRLKVNLAATLLVTLKSINHFTLTAYVNMPGEVLVDLKFQDEYSDNGMSFYETSSRLGGILNPLLGNIHSISHNAAQIDALTVSAVAKVG